MKRTKALRRRCDLPACGKLYRHSDPRSRTCSATCRLRLYRAHKKAADQVAQEQIEAERQAKASAMSVRMVEQAAERERQVESNRQPAPAPRPTTAPPPPTPTPWPYTHIQPLEPKEQTVTIKVPNRFPGTSLRRRRN